MSQSMENEDMQLAVGDCVQNLSSKQNGVIVSIDKESGMYTIKCDDNHEESLTADKLQLVLCAFAKRPTKYSCAYDGENEIGCLCVLPNGGSCEMAQRGFNSDQCQTCEIWKCEADFDRGSEICKACAKEHHAKAETPVVCASSPPTDAAAATTSPQKYSYILLSTRESSYERIRSFSTYEAAQSKQKELLNKDVIHYWNFARSTLAQHADKSMEDVTRVKIHSNELTKQKLCDLERCVHTVMGNRVPSTTMWSIEFEVHGRNPIIEESFRGVGIEPLTKAIDRCDRFLSQYPQAMLYMCMPLRMFIALPEDGFPFHFGTASGGSWLNESGWDLKQLKQFAQGYISVWEHSQTPFEQLSTTDQAAIHVLADKANKESPKRRRIIKLDDAKNEVATDDEDSTDHDDDDEQS
jgi:hypothetical protein